MILPSVHWQVAFRFGHSQVQNEFRPWINGQQSKRRTDGQHAFWILANNFFEGSDNFICNEQGKGWVNEVEGLINQKCPQADLRLENSLTNSLFGGSATGRDFVGGRKTNYIHNWLSLLSVPKRKTTVSQPKDYWGAHTKILLETATLCILYFCISLILKLFS